VAIGLYCPVLKCHWVSWEVIMPGVLALHLMPGNCCDMRGAIKMAKRLHPEVTAIWTFSGENRDTYYVRSGDGEWEAREPAELDW
jgi:hypothetical protein